MTPEMWAAMSQRQETFESRLAIIHDENSRLIAERTLVLERLAQAIGERSADGKGGTGLVGEIARVQRDLAELIALKNQGIGLIIAVSIFGALIVLGLRNLIVGWVTPHP